MAATFSSVQMRERDKLIEERHKKDMEALERKFERVKRSLNDADREIFDLRNRGNHLAQALGFSDIGEAQRAIDMSDHELTFKQALERIQGLEGEIRTGQRQREELQLRSQGLEEELAKWRERSSSAEKRERRLQQELRDLKTQFDSMKESFEKDRRTFRGVHRWLFVEPFEKKGGTDGGLSTKKAQQRNAHRRRELLREFGPGLAKLLNVDFAALEKAARDVDDSTSPQPAAPSEPQVAAELDSRQQDPSVDTLEHSRLKKSTEPPGTHLASGQSRLRSAREPLTLLPITTNLTKQEPGETPKPTKSRKTRMMQHSSDTEEDPEAPSQSFKIPLPSRLPIARGLGNSSDTEDDSQAPNGFSSSPTIPPETPLPLIMEPIVGRLMRPDLPSRPSVNHARRQSDTKTPDIQFRIKIELDDDLNILEDEPPAKRPRISLDPFFKTPQHAGSRASPQRAGFSTGHIPRGKKLFGDENTPIAKVPAATSTSAQMKPGDYSVYKGRGRYAQGNKTVAKTINSLFTINPERNGGVNHQYEEVVRARADRIHMDAGDCECCRDYYAAVGPLPPRNQGPLWRSPSTTPVKSCRRGAMATSSTHNENDGVSSPLGLIQAELEAHKKAVSRHRHNWARAQTPPGYWNIGFPTTQEAQEINERAEEMHRRKLREVGREAERGRYLRR